MAQQKDNIVIRTEALCFHRQNKKQLCSIDLTIQQAEIWSIIGPNGAGKTTLLQLLAGLIQPTHGTIYFNNQPLSQISMQQRAQKIAVVDQLTPSDIPLTVTDYIALGKIPRPHSEDILELDELLNLLSLFKLRHHKLSQLSGGERQRAHIARAIYQQPQLLFLDEPTNHLDPAIGYELLSWLNTLGITLVMVLHDLNLAKHFSTHTILLKQGKLVDAGNNHTVLHPHKLSGLFNISVLELPHPTQIDKIGFIAYERI